MGPDTKLQEIRDIINQDERLLASLGSHHECLIKVKAKLPGRFPRWSKQASEFGYGAIVLMHDYTITWDSRHKSICKKFVNAKPLKHDIHKMAKLLKLITIKYYYNEINYPRTKNGEYGILSYQYLINEV